MAGNVVVDGTEPSRTVGTPSPAALAAVAVLGASALAAAVISVPHSAPVTPAPASTFPVLEPGVDGWRRLDLPGSGSLRTVATRGEAVVAAGEGPQFWWSDDAGLSWRRSSTRTGDAGSVTGVAIGPSVAVAAGTTVDQEGRASPAVWRSDHGSEWEDVAVPVEGTVGGLDGVVAFEDRFVAWGWTGRPDDFAPGVGPLLLVSVDGTQWEQVDVGPPGTRLRAVVRAGGRWLAMGSREGQPVIWETEDLRRWELIDTHGMPFGWTMVDAYDDGTLTVNLLDPARRATRRYRLLEDGTWKALGTPIENGPVSVERELDGLTGVGHGVLWTADPGWEGTSLEGELLASDGDVAVGGHAGQPVAWVRSGTEAPSVVRLGTGDQEVWDRITELGPGPLTGPYPVAEGYVVGAGGRWWFVHASGHAEVDDLEGRDVERIDRVDGAWVATPAMMWSTDGRRWDERTVPWDVEGGGSIFGVADTRDGGALAVGATDAGFVTAAETTDGGKSWIMTRRSGPSTPIRDVRAVPGGFLGVAARPRNRSQVVETTDGVTWTPLAVQEMVAGSGSAVALVEGDDVYLPVGDQRFRRPPTATIDAIARSAGGEVAVVSGARLYLGPGEWRALPVDPAAGIEGTAARPLLVDGRILMVDVDRGTVGMYELIAGR